jgi:type IX secretion system PorP/SprF family membrane protein
MKKKFCVLMLLALLTVSAYSQQEPQFSQYMYTILPFNPGYAGSGGICASATYRQQWAGFNETDESGKKVKVNPRQALFSFHAPIKALHGGLGLSIYNDALGHQNDIAVKLAYAFRMNIGGGTLGIGLSIDFLNRSLKRSDFDQNSRSADPLMVGALRESTMYFDGTIGFFYQMPEKWYAGLSATRLLSLKNSGTDAITQRFAQHLYAMGGYTFILPSNPNWTLTPSGLVKTDLRVCSFELTLLAEWNKIFWFGGSYRLIDCATLLFGAKPFINYSSAIRGLEVVLSYDINTSKVITDRRSFGGPEITLKYCFSIVTKPSIYGYKGTRLLGNRPVEYR